MTEFGEIITNIILTVVSVSLTVGLPLIIKELFSFLREKKFSEKSFLVSCEVERAVSNAVKATSQRFVDDLKMKAADGKLTLEEQGEALHATINSAYAMLTQKTKAYLETQLDENALGEYLETLIESEIVKRKG